MKFHVTLAAAVATFLMPGAITQSHAQQQVVETINCQSTSGSRTSCAVQGEIISAGIERQFGDGSPCFLGFTWGFEENGIWTGNGCSAQFAVTVERASAQPVVDPQILQNRLRDTRNALRTTRQELIKEQESRRVLEAELAEAESALRAAEAAAPNSVQRKRRPQMAIRSVSVCSNKAIRDAKKAGASEPRVAEILSARPTQGSWLVIGRLRADRNNNRSTSYFRCWTEKGKIISYSNEI